MSQPSFHSAEYERRERRALGKIGAIRRTDSDAAREVYFSECRNLCCNSVEGLEYDAARAIVWKDIVLGLGAAQPVPYLSQSIIRQEREQHQQRLAEELHRSQAPPRTLDVSGSAAEVVAAETPLSSQRNCETRDAAAAASQQTGTSSNTPTAPRKRHCNSNDDGTEAPEQPRRRRAASQVVRRADTAADDGRPTAGAGASPPDRGGPASRLRPPVALRLPENCQPRVVEADIQRSLWALYPEATERDVMRRQLKDMLLRVLANNPSRYYYQGLHEVMGFVMYVLTPYLANEVVVSVCEDLLRTRWASFSEESLNTSESLLYAMHAVVAEEDPQLAMSLEACGVAPESHYAVSWMITWYAHSIADTVVLGRLFDYFVVDEDGLGVVFFTAAYVVSQRERILQWVADAEAEAREFGEDAGVLTMAKVYAQITKMPADTLAVATVDYAADLIQKANHYREKHLTLVHDERDNFVNGNVRKLGYLANQRTRNAALRLLWALLPREWRNPVKRRQGVGRMVLMASAVLAAALVVFSAKENPDWPGMMFR